MELLGPTRLPGTPELLGLLILSGSMLTPMRGSPIILRPLLSFNGLKKGLAAGYCPGGTGALYGGAFGMNAEPGAQPMPKNLAPLSSSCFFSSSCIFSSGLSPIITSNMSLRYCLLIINLTKGEGTSGSTSQLSIESSFLWSF